MRSNVAFRPFAGRGAAGKSTHGASADGGAPRATALPRCRSRAAGRTVRRAAGEDADRAADFEPARVSRPRQRGEGRVVFLLLVVARREAPRIGVPGIEIVEIGAPERASRHGPISRNSFVAREDVLDHRARKQKAFRVVVDQARDLRAMAQDRGALALPVLAGGNRQPRGGPSGSRSSATPRPQMEYSKSLALRRRCAARAMA